MNKDTIKLAYVLAVLFIDVTDSLRIIEEVGELALRINVNVSAISRWQKIVDECIKAHRLQILIATALKYYPDNVELQEFNCKYF